MPRYHEFILLQKGLANGGGDRVPVFVIHPTTSVVSAMEKMSSTHSHRVWIVEGADKLLGVVTLTDFIKVMN